MKNTLIVLGYSDAGISTLSEMANECCDMSDFHIVMNVKRPEPVRPYEWPEFSFSYFDDKDYPFFQSDMPVQFGVFDAHIKYLLYHWFEHQFTIAKNRYLSLLHPGSYVARSTTYGNGFYIEPMSVISTFTNLGMGVSIKRGALVGHHVTIGDFVTLNPGAHIAGSVTIETGATIGLGAIINNHVTIGKGSVIGAGSVVTKDIPEGVIAFGNPCRVIKENERWHNTIQTVQKFTL